MYAKYFACVLLIAAVLTGVNVARADLIFADNFESYATGDLVGKTNAWGTWALSSTKSLQVIVDPTDSSNQVLTTANSTAAADADSGAKITWATPLTFTTADKSEIYYSVRMNKGGTGTYARTNTAKTYISLSWDASAWKGSVGTYAASDTYNDTPKNCVLPMNTPFSYGETIMNDTWYDVKVELDFSVDGVRARYYRCLSGTGDWAKDDTIGDANLLLYPTDGKFTSSGICFFMRRTSSSYPQYGFVDNISIVKVVPEPGTLALLGCGLAGLLCYAWRKRK